MRYLILVALLTGCGGTYQDYLRSAIVGTKTACELGEQLIVDREGTTLAQDERDLSRIRAGCNVAYTALDELTRVK